MRRGLIWLSFLLAISGLSSSAARAAHGGWAAGGEMRFLWSASVADGERSSNELIDSLTLELFLPSQGRNELRYEFTLVGPGRGLIGEKETQYLAEKLYVRHRRDKFHLTMGRQPVTWSFGSLLNPADFTLGAAGWGAKQSSGSINAVAAYVPWGWNSGLDLVAAWPQGLWGKPKWGTRARLDMGGYDVTASYIAEDPAATPIPHRRANLTVKGDMANMGVYGTVGLHFNDNTAPGMGYMVGADWSHRWGYHNLLTMQVEYLGLRDDKSVLLLTPLLGVQANNSAADFLTGKAGYAIDDFSALSLLVVGHLNDQSLMVAPMYKNTLGESLDLLLGATILTGAAGSLFPAGHGALTVGISYSF